MRKGVKKLIYFYNINQYSNKYQKNVPTKTFIQIIRLDRHK